jgi:transposase-like protein
MKVCPKCNSSNTKKIYFNAFGLIGALIANEYRCLNCKSKFKSEDGNKNSQINTVTDNNVVPLKIPDNCPHCKNPNNKKIRLCEWCGNQII